MGDRDDLTENPESHERRCENLHNRTFRGGKNTHSEEIGRIHARIVFEQAESEEGKDTEDNPIFEGKWGEYSKIVQNLGEDENGRSHGISEEP